ncbi:hypothetical protein J6590_025655 [Homalodisca vitripennis]|nr:hypothetical protein J6590_025655 [Homalodisca vitripennis]
MHSPVFVSEGGNYHSHGEKSADQELVDAATVFVDQLLAQAQQEVQNKRLAAEPPQPAKLEADQEDEDLTTIDGLLRRGNRWHNRARQGARGLVSRLLTTLRLCK